MKKILFLTACVCMIGAPLNAFFRNYHPPKPGNGYQQTPQNGKFINQHAQQRQKTQQQQKPQQQQGKK